MLQAPLYFEDVEVGYKFQTPGGRTITNAEVVNFAQITGDYNLVHLDHEFAKTGMYGENIAHGALTLTLAGGMLKRTEFWSATAETLGDLTGFKHVKFMAPVKFNSTIHLECEITDKTDNGDGTGTVYADVTLRDSMAFATTFMEDAQAAIDAGDLQSLDEAGAKVLLGELYQAAMDKTTAMTTDYVSLEVVKNGDSWQVDEDSWGDELDYLFGL